MNGISIVFIFNTPLSAKMPALHRERPALFRQISKGFSSESYVIFDSYYFMV